MLRIIFYVIIICTILSYCAHHADTKGLIEIFKWKQIDFHNEIEPNAQLLSDTQQGLNRKNAGIIYFPERNIRNKRHNVTSAKQKSSGAPSYIPYNNVPMGVTHYKNRLFITIPRRRVGIPSTLNYIDLEKVANQTSPKLHAYPDYETNQLKPNSNNLVSVYRTSLDTCNRLWFIDTGTLEYPNNIQQVQRPSIWIIDVNTDKLIKRFEIPTSIVNEGQGLASITIDTDKGCDKTYAYIPDLLHNQLYVYDLATNDIWAFHHNYFHFDPLAGDMTIGGESFSWNDGIFSITLGPKEKDNSRNVMFHPMASLNEFYVNSAILQNKTHAESRNYNYDFIWLGNRGEARQSTMHEYDPHTGVVFYSEIQRNGVGCWNAKQRFSPETHDTVAEDPQRMIYPADLTIDDDGFMWVMTNSMPIFIYSSLDPNEYNFRVWKRQTSEAIVDTKCLIN